MQGGWMKRLIALCACALVLSLGLHVLWVYMLKDQCDLGLTPEECASLPNPKILGIWEP
jgi:hypothetical protein